MKPDLLRQVADLPEKTSADLRILWRWSKNGLRTYSGRFRLLGRSLALKSLSGKCAIFLSKSSELLYFSNIAQENAGLGLDWDGHFI